MRRWSLMIAIALSLRMTAVAHASFHFMQIEQVVAGVGGDPSAQAIQLRTRLGGQNLVHQPRLIVRDATGANPVLLLDITSDVADHGVGMRILLVSAGMAGKTTPALAADFTLAATIPASYLPGGSLTFEDDFGTIYWRLSWGNYTGPTTGSITNDANGNFGAPFGGPLPTWEQGPLFQGDATALSTTNLADYALTAGAAVLQNVAGGTFTVSVPTDNSPRMRFEPLSNWPNPFNPATEIVFVREHPGMSSLRIYDAQGRVVATLVDGPLAAGRQHVSWDGMDYQGRPAPSGAYVARLWSADRVETRKLLLLK